MMKFSQSSRTAAPSIEGVPDTNLPKLTRHAQRTKRTQGVALVVVLLSAMVLMVSMLAISATMAISSQRATADQNITLQAQYAAEAGVARANYGLTEAYNVMSRLTVTTTSSSASIVNEQLKTHTRNYCNGTYVAAASKYDFYRSWSPTEKENGIALCGTSPLNNRVGTANLASRFSLFGTYVPANAYPTGVSPSDYWPTVFTPPPADVTTRVASNTTNGTESWYTVRYGANNAPITPTKAVLIRPNYYRFYFRVNQGGVSATGEVRAGSRVLASRIVEKQMTVSDDESYIDIELPSFARNFVFRNQTTNTSGGQLYFAGGESFDGPVHTNGTPGFYKLSGQTPVFSDDFTSCAANGTYAGYGSPPTQTELQQTFTGGSPTFGVNCIGMPDNSYNQLRAAYGGNVGETEPVTCADLASNWGLKVSSSCKNVSGTAPSKNQEYDAIPVGIYYSKGNPTSGSSGSPNSGNEWNSEIDENGGGLYVKGNVNQLKLSVQPSGTNIGKQIIEVTQVLSTTRFEEQANGSWIVKVGGVTVKTLTGTFNGMIYVDGDIADMRGNGTTTNGVPDPDIAANSQLTVATTGKVIVKDDITYSVDPADNPGATNVLGIYSSGDRCDRTPSTGIGSCGSILVDGGLNKDMNIDASIMASHDGEGFGAVNYNQVLGLLGGRKVQINLTGGVIEDQSQTVGTVGNAGYARAYKYDQRFKDGVVKPPFFPERTAQWRVFTDRFNDNSSSVWQTVAN